MYGSNFAIESDKLGFREIKGKGGTVRIGFDTKMFGLGSEQAVKDFLNSCLEDWRKKNPKSSPTEIKYEISSRVDLIVGGRVYAGYLYFKP